MPTINLAVTASTDDVHSASNLAASRPLGGSATVIPSQLTDTLFSPGSHGSTDDYYGGARFLNVTVPQGATINSATFTLKAQASYNAGSNTVALIVYGQNSDTTITFGTLAGSDDMSASSRPRTTAASGTWNVTSVTGESDYSIAVTSVVQEIVNRAGWASGNSMVMLVGVHATCTNGEWQDFYSYNGATAKAPKLDITYTVGGAGGGYVPPTRRFRSTLYKR